MSFSNGKKKAITFSFDDGNTDDVRLVEVLNRYGLKATFNLNSGSLTEAFKWVFNGTKEVHHLNYADYPDLYKGHEVASHGYTHPHLEQMDSNTLKNELFTDKKLLSALYGLKEVRGFALPFGTYNDDVLKEVAAQGFAYCRTIHSTLEFSLPDNLLIHPTCHFKNPKVNELVEKFFEDSDEDKLFYIWGHSYELVTEEDWENFENLCKRLSNRSDVWYCTNIEVVDDVHSR